MPSIAGSEAEISIAVIGRRTYHCGCDRGILQTL
jgi:hypothetical protein